LLAGLGAAPGEGLGCADGDGVGAKVVIAATFKLREESLSAAVIGGFWPGATVVTPSAVGIPS